MHLSGISLINPLYFGCVSGELWCLFEGVMFSCSFIPLHPYVDVCTFEVTVTWLPLEVLSMMLHREALFCFDGS